MKKELHPETLAIRNQMAPTSYQEHSTPLFLTSSFIFEDAEDMRASFSEEKERNIYSRFSNPNNQEFIEKLCSLEDAQAGYSFASGMAAVFSTFAALLSSGDHIISSRALFGSTHTLFTKYFPKWGITTSYFSPADPMEELEALLRPSTKILYAETPTNPGVELLDIQLLSNFCKKHELLLVIDNCFATPVIQQPLRLGADLVIHSATKLIDGQGRVLGGAVLGAKELIQEIYLFARNTGPALSPFHGWILSKSIETLHIRVEKQSANALQLATKLETVPEIALLKYPFLPSHPQFGLAKKQMRYGGNIISMDLKGGLQAGQKFINSVNLCSRSANLGDSRTIVTHPASTTHSKLSPEERIETGITDGLVRISVGLEYLDDIWYDIHRALTI